MEKQKKARQSTDLEEYVFKVPKNFIELQVGAKFSTFEKSEKSGFSEKSGLFFWESEIWLNHMMGISELSTLNWKNQCYNIFDCSDFWIP